MKTFLLLAVSYHIVAQGDLIALPRASIGGSAVSNRHVNFFAVELERFFDQHGNAVG